MKSPTSFINRGILLNDFKRFTWIGAGYLLALLLSVPLKVFMLYSRAEDAGINDIYTLARVFQFDVNASFMQVMITIIVPVLTGLLLFRYLQDGRAADMAHALPVKRDAFYNTHIFFGLTVLFGPLIITALLSWALVTGLGIGQVKSADILAWLSVSLLINLLFFTCSAAVGMVTGMSTVQGVLSFILLLLPSGLSMLLLDNMDKYIYGFPYDYYLDKIINLSPLIRMTGIATHPFTPGEITVYLLISAALYLAGRYFYRRRQLETAGNAITFDTLRPVFKYGVTFCFMLLCGSYFYSSQDSTGWMYFGYFLGSLLAYFLAEVLLNKSLHVFQLRNVKDYGIYALVIIALLGLLYFDCTGYEKSLPAPDKIKSIYLDDSFYALKEKDNNRRTAVNMQNGVEGVEPDYQPPVPAIFTGKDNIANIYALHRQIVANRLNEKKAPSLKHDGNTRQICLAYELENGSHIYRQYEITAADYAAFLKPIYESREYKELHNEILRTNVADINFIEISAAGTNKNVLISNPDSVAQAFSALKSDVYAETYEDMTPEKTPWAHINISLTNHRSIGLDWKKSYVNFEQWLKITGEYEKARLLPDEVDFAVIDRLTEVNKPGRYRQTLQQDVLNLQNKPGTLKITGPEQLELCLRNYYEKYVEEAAYGVYFKLKNGETISGFLIEAEAPAFIKEHFAK